MALPDYKVYTLAVSENNNIIVPIIVSDELFNNGSAYDISIANSVERGTLEGLIELVNSNEDIKKLTEIPIVTHEVSNEYINGISTIFTNRRLSNFTGSLTVGSVTYDFTYSENSYYRNGSVQYQKFPTVRNSFSYNSGSIKTVSYETHISILPSSAVVNGELLVTSEPQQAYIFVSYRYGSVNDLRITVDFAKASNTYIYNYKSFNGYKVDEIKPLQPINFYANPANYECNNGETVTPNFALVYGDGTIIEPYTDIIYDESKYFKDNISTLNDDGISINVAESNTIKRLSYTVRPNIADSELYAVFAIDVLDAKNPYFPEGDSGEGGGNGSYGNGENYFDTAGRIPNGSAEANDSRGTLYTRYLVSLHEMSVLGDWLWADDLGLQIAKTAISLLYGDPVQTVISCVSYPFNLSSLVGNSAVSFHWGGHDAGFTLNALNSNAFSIDWGYIFLSEYWGNFLDYSPHTQMQLYLPWGTGFVHIDPNDILNANSNSILTGTGTLGIKTNVDLSRGICVHNVIANNTVIGSYSGSCGRQIPITGSDYASKQVAMAGAAIGAMVAGGVSAGMGAQAASTGQNIFGEPPSDINRRYMTESSVRADMFGSEVSAVGRMAMRPAIASAAALAVSPPSVSRSGSFQEGAGSLSIQQPYLIISRPKMSMPKNYGHMYGYPSNISSTLSSLTGYTEVGNIHLEGIYATSEELNEIESLLKSGVLL